MAVAMTFEHVRYASGHQAIRPGTARDPSVRTLRSCAVCGIGQQNFGPVRFLCSYAMAKTVLQADIFFSCRTRGTRSFLNLISTPKKHRRSGALVVVELRGFEPLTF